MPWKVCKLMDERLKFIARLLDGEQMAGLCREFGISRKAGYKTLTRYNAVGLGWRADPARGNRVSATRIFWKTIQLGVGCPNALACHAFIRSARSSGFMPS
jgi:hypothetical protein